MGRPHALRYTPAGLLVKERSISQSSLVLKASLQPDGCHHEGGCKPDGQQRGHLRLQRKLPSQDWRQRCPETLRSHGQHITQSEGKEADADATAKKALEDGRQKRTVTVNVLGDTALLTGETVEVREAKTGLTGIFWIDADIHTWKNKNYYSKLTLNCRNVMATANAGG